jgi:hypothetical protein
MEARDRQVATLVIGGLILGVMFLAAVATIDYLRHPRYYEVKPGMTSKEVDVIIGAGCDSYPDGNGMVSYYFASEGTIVVYFDAQRRVYRKALRP